MSVSEIVAAPKRRLRLCFFSSSPAPGSGSRLCSLELPSFNHRDKAYTIQFVVCTSLPRISISPSSTSPPHLLHAINAIHAYIDLILAPCLVRCALVSIGPRPGPDLRSTPRHLFCITRTNSLTFAHLATSREAVSGRSRVARTLMSVRCSPSFSHGNAGSACQRQEESKSL